MEAVSFGEVCNLLEQETLLLRSIADTELEKRRHILSANGRKLHDLTRKSEILLAEQEALGGRRSQLAGELIAPGVVGRELTLREVVDAAIAAGANEAERLQTIADRFRVQVQEVEGQVAENARLLGLAGQSLRRLLQGLTEAAGQTETYRPRGEEGRRRAESVILNANA